MQMGPWEAGMEATMTVILGAALVATPIVFILGCMVISMGWRETFYIIGFALLMTASLLSSVTIDGSERILVRPSALSSLASAPIS